MSEMGRKKCILLYMMQNNQKSCYRLLMISQGIRPKTWEFKI